MGEISMNFKLVLIRHGFSEDNKNRIFSGSRDPHVTREGIDELSKLRTSVDYPKTDRYVTSDLIRTIETIRTLMPEQEYSVNPNFREQDFGDYEGVGITEERVRYFYGKVYDDIAYENAELLSDVMKRVDKGIHQEVKDCIKDNCRSLSIFSHGMTIKIILYYFRLIDKEMIVTMPIGNGLGFILDLDIENNEITCSNYLAI